MNAMQSGQYLEQSQRIYSDTANNKSGTHESEEFSR